MLRALSTIVITTTLICGSLAMTAQAQKSESNPRVSIETSLGEIVVELDSAAAPKTVANFLQYARDGFYDGTVFHRVIKGFMIQGGGMTPDLARKQTRAPVENEADNGLKNDRGTIAMARTNDPHSATSQFFINTVDNAALNHSGKNPRGWGYCVFGKVVSGMETVDKIEGVQTTSRGPYRDVPAQTVPIEKVTVVGEKDQAE
ncbi:MAG: peptidyl-prolyl cis-trans isomerase [Chitinivibrionales bacterium]|nr:peptidyl-prolyl cis-trans isomerase [Chitinivibrionales bacterium]